MKNTLLFIALILICAGVYAKVKMSDAADDKKIVTQIMSDYGYANVKIVGKRELSIFEDEALAVGTEYDVLATKGSIAINVQIFYRPLDKMVRFYQNKQRVNLKKDPPPQNKM